MKKNKTFKILDKGFIRFVGSLGNDKTIVDAARVSYQKGTIKKRDDDKLIDYLVRNRHTSPLEMVEISVHVKAPIFVARQWFRHRMGEFNEMSLRYSEAPDEFYRPEHWRTQDSKNRQASGALITDPDLIEECYADLEVANNMAMKSYKSLIDAGVAREMARMVLPSNLYTSWYWKANLRSMAHFVDLRDDDNAQYEIREYAKVLKTIIKDICPVACASLQKHVWKDENE